MQGFLLTGRMLKLEDADSGNCFLKQYLGQKSKNRRMAGFEPVAKQRGLEPRCAQYYRFEPVLDV
jgi:hypothetical protein